MTVRENSRWSTDWISDRLRAHVPRREERPVRATVAFIFRVPTAAHDAAELLFIKRAEHPRDPWSGHMALPGGRLDVNDADAEAAVLRETREEVDIDLARDATRIAQLDDQLALRPEQSQLVITPFVYVLREPLDGRLSAEVSELHWIPARRLFDPTVQSTTAIESGGRRIELPCWRINERVIWGLTFQMSHRLFALLDWS